MTRAYDYLPFNKSIEENSNNKKEFKVFDSSCYTKQLISFMTQTVNDKLVFHPILRIFSQQGTFHQFFSKDKSTMTINFLKKQDVLVDKVAKLYDFVMKYETDTYVLKLFQSYEDEVVKILLDNRYEGFDDFESMKKYYIMLCFLSSFVFYKTLSERADENVNYENIAQIINITYGTVTVSFSYDKIRNGKIQSTIDDYFIYDKEVMYQLMSMLNYNMVFGLKYDFLINQLTSDIDDKHKLKNIFFSKRTFNLQFGDKDFHYLNKTVSTPYYNSLPEVTDEQREFQPLLVSLFKDTERLKMICQNEKNTVYKSTLFRKSYIQSFYKKVKKQHTMNDNIFEDFNKIHTLKQFDDFKTELIDIQNFLNLTHKFNEPIALLFMYKTLNYLEELNELMQKKDTSSTRLKEAIYVLKDTVIQVNQFVTKELKPLNRSKEFNPELLVMDSMIVQTENDLTDTDMNNLKKHLLG